MDRNSYLNFVSEYIVLANADNLTFHICYAQFMLISDCGLELYKCYAPIFYVHLEV
jgi:hypothetical protein